jgi:hypothetical protein
MEKMLDELAASLPAASDSITTVGVVEVVVGALVLVSILIL